MLRLAAAMVLVVLLVAACEDDPDTLPTVASVTPVVVTSTSIPPGPQPTESTTSVPISNEPLGTVGLARAFANLTPRQATGMYQGPGGRFFITEQPGRILVFGNLDDSTPEMFLDIQDRVRHVGFEEGLLGLALAPDFAQSGHFYVYYSASAPRRSVVSRFFVGPAASFADAASEVVILEVEQPFANHNGGQIAFGADGFLYIALGDGGGGTDPRGNGQNLNTLLGKILRIDVEASGQNEMYSIPADNPFAGQRPNDIREEIWAYGLRNPWRFSFDQETGELWVADVGHSRREEIDLVLPGANLGWNIMEGNLCLSTPGCDRSGLTAPVFDYNRTGGNCSVTGGFVYRGEVIPSLNGAYVYGDFCSGRVWALRFDGGAVTENKLIATVDGNVSSFAVDSDGEIYVLTYDQAGSIFKLVPAD